MIWGALSILAFSAGVLYFAFRKGRENELLRQKAIDEAQLRAAQNAAIGALAKWPVDQKKASNMALRIERAGSMRELHELRREILGQKIDSDS